MRSFFHTSFCASLVFLGTAALTGCGKKTEVTPVPASTVTVSDLHQTPGPPSEAAPADVAYATMFNFVKEQTQRQGWQNVVWYEANPSFSDGNEYPFFVSHSKLANTGPNGQREYYHYSYFYDRDYYKNGSGTESAIMFDNTWIVHEQ